jgi:hypothetical protein
MCIWHLGGIIELQELNKPIRVLLYKHAIPITVVLQNRDELAEMDEGPSSITFKHRRRSRNSNTRSKDVVQFNYSK